jgi:hypothetical protein
VKSLRLTGSNICWTLRAGIGYVVFSEVHAADEAIENLKVCSTKFIAVRTSSQSFHSTGYAHQWKGDKSEKGKKFLHSKGARHCST